MQGVILDELEKYVASKLGQPGLQRIRNLTGRGDSGYDFGGKYPDDELVVIMRGLVEATGRPPEEIVEEFGIALVPGLLEVYGFLSIRVGASSTSFSTPRTPSIAASSSTRRMLDRPSCKPRVRGPSR